MLYFLKRNIVLVIFNGHLFKTIFNFGKNMRLWYFSVVQKKKIRKNHVLSIKSFCQKDSSSTWTWNKYTVIAKVTCHMCHSMGANFCHSNSVTFDAKKVKETLMTWLNWNTITEKKKFVIAKIYMITPSPLVKSQALAS